MALPPENGCDLPLQASGCQSPIQLIHKELSVKALLSPGRRELQKRDLPGLTSDEVFKFVLQHYLKK
jgi:hypothetical protein